MDSLRRPIVTLSDSFNRCQAVKSDKGTGSDKRLRIVTVMLRQVFCGTQGATLALATTATMLADASDEGPRPLSFVACGNERTSPCVRDFRIQHRCDDNIADVLRAYANSQNGNWLSADSNQQNLLDTSEFEALFCVSVFVATLNNSCLGAC